MLDIFSALHDSMNGLPTERRAVASICFFTTCSLGLVGSLGGPFLVPGWNSASLVLFAVGGGVLVYSVYGFFGFRCVVWLAAFYVGAVLGLVIGLFLDDLFGVWAYLLAPLLGLLNAIFRPFARIRPKALPSEEPLKVGEWRRKKW